LLCKFQSIDIPNLSKFSKKELEDQSSLFIEVFCSQFLEIKSTDALKEFVKQTVENIMLQPWANCHFDYERRNLISDLTENKIHMIDYQDTRIGPIGIDIAGILIDHYYPLNKQDINGHLDFYKSISVYKDKELDFFEILRWGGIQRNLRILGVLSRLSIEKNLDFRLKDIPMIFNNLIAIMPKDSPGYFFLTNTVKNKLNERIHNL
jgi:aminoglycoside/choline kinase family phosphotransferase